MHVSRAATALCPVERAEDLAPLRDVHPRATRARMLDSGHRVEKAAGTAAASPVLTPTVIDHPADRGRRGKGAFAVAEHQLRIGRSGLRRAKRLARKQEGLIQHVSHGGPLCVAAKAHERAVNRKKSGGMRNHLLAQYGAECCLMGHRQRIVMPGFGIVV